MESCQHLLGDCGDEREDVDYGNDVICGILSTCVGPPLTIALTVKWINYAGQLVVLLLMERCVFFSGSGDNL